MFSHGSTVIDIPNGSMRTLKRLISNEPVTLVMYYAPWCHISRKTALHFEQAAEALNGEV